VLHIKPIWLCKCYLDWSWLQKSSCCYSLFTTIIHKALKGLWRDLGWMNFQRKKHSRFYATWKHVGFQCYPLPKESRQSTNFPNCAYVWWINNQHLGKSKSKPFLRCCNFFRFNLYPTLAWMHAMFFKVCLTSRCFYLWFHSCSQGLWRESI